MMKKIKDFCRTRLGFAILSNIITISVSLILFRPFWEESDDVRIALIPEGSFGYRDSHLVFANVIYGKILCFLQGVFSGIRWHAVLMYLAMFLLVTAFVYVLAKDNRGRLLSLVFLLGTFYEMYVSVQFTKVSAFLAILAFVILFETIRDNDMLRSTRIRLRVIAVAGTSFSALLRIESFLFACIAAGAYGICLVIYDLKKGELLSKIRQYIVCFLPVFALAGLFAIIDNISYSADGWSRYREYNEACGQLTDYHFNALIYDLHGPELEQLGVSENDAYLFITYQYADNEFFDLDLMEKIREIDKKGLSYIDIDFIKAWVANIYNEFFTLNTLPVVFFILTGLFVLYTLESKEKSFLLLNAGIQTALFGIMLFWFQYSCRWNHRVVVSLIMFDTVLLIYALNRIMPAVPDKGLLTCMFTLLFVGGVYLRLGNEFSYQEFKRSTPDYEAVIEYMQQNKDMLFVGETYTMNDYGIYDIFSASSFGQFDNYVTTGSCYTTNTPIDNGIVARFGYSNAFEALRSRDDNVILLDNKSPKTKEIYCNEHGEGEYTLEQTGSVGNIALYRLK